MKGFCGAGEARDTEAQLELRQVMKILLHSRRDAERGRWLGSSVGVSVGQRDHIHSILYVLIVEEGTRHVPWRSRRNSLPKGQFNDPVSLVGLLFPGNLRWRLRLAVKCRWSFQTEFHLFYSKMNSKVERKGRAGQHSNVASLSLPTYFRPLLWEQHPLWDLWRLSIGWTEKGRHYISVSSLDMATQGRKYREVNHRNSATRGRCPTQREKEEDRGNTCWLCISRTCFRLNLHHS